MNDYPAYVVRLVGAVTVYVECSSEEAYTEQCIKAREALESGLIQAWQGYQLWSY